jgi:predicted PurR-regulated permease PerM
MRLFDRLTHRRRSAGSDRGPDGPRATRPHEDRPEVIRPPDTAPALPTPIVIRGWTMPGYGQVFRVAVTAGLGVAVAGVLAGAARRFGDVLVLIVLAFVFALGLDPLVRILVRRGWRRTWAVAAVVAGVLLVFAGFVAAILPPIIDQTTQLVNQAPHFLAEIQDRHSWLGGLLARFGVVSAVKNQVAPKLPDALGGVLGVGGAIVGATAAMLTIGVLAVYFTANLPAVERAMWRSAPASRRARVAQLGERIFDQIGGYLLGNVITSVIAGVGTWVFLLIVGVPYPLALGIMVAVLDLIPVVGSTVGGLVVSLVALSVSVPVAIVTLVYYVVYRLLEDYLLSPKIMERTVDVPPLLTIVALLLGGAVAGIVGAFLAIPVAAAVQLLLREVVWPRLDAT